MKSKLFLLATLATLILASCEVSMPEWNENSRKELVGIWKVEKETMTNGDGFDGVVTRTDHFFWGNDTYRFTETQVYMWNSQTQHFAEIQPYDYTLQTQQDGTWLITVPGLFDKERNLEGGLSPITIHKLTKTQIEMSFESYGGDEGPVGYYQYLEKQMD